MTSRWLPIALVFTLLGSCSGSGREHLNQPTETHAGPSVPEALPWLLTHDGADRGLNPTPELPEAMEELEAEFGDKDDDASPRIKTWKRSQIVPNTTKLSVGDDEDLPLEAMSATVRVEGFRARVVLDCFYRNDRKQQLEGTFKARLPDSASPYYFAFGELEWKKPDFGSAVGTTLAALRAERTKGMTTVKEARIVPREKAAHAYGDTVRRKIDPALMEWAGAGVFNARLFPLQPEKLHRVVLGYEVNLLPVGDDLEFRLDLPEAIPELEVSMLVRGARHTVTPPATVQLGTYHWRNPDQRSFVARIQEPGAILLEGSDEATGSCFATQLRPALPRMTADARDRGVFLVDISLSSNPERFNVWLKLLSAILDSNRETMREFAVVFFNVEAFPWRDGFVENTAASVAELMEEANQLALEGATDLGSALRKADSLDGEFDLFLLSDGAPTWGENDLHALARTLGESRTLFAYRTGFSGTDLRTLNHLARESGGGVFSVVGGGEVAAAAVAHVHRPWQLLGIEAEGASDFLLAGRPTSIFPGQTLTLAGRGAPKDEITLTFRSGDGTDVLRASVEIASRIDSELARGVYGDIAVGQLEDLGWAAVDSAKAYATHFRVVGKTCSLLMLESEEEYESYNIKPEEDAFVVKNRPAAELVHVTLSDLGDTLADPKARFVAWLNRLEKTPGVEFGIPEALRIALEKIPAESFEVAPEPLACKTRLWRQVPGPIQEQLASKKLTYDSISTEAERRRAETGPADALRAASSLVETSPGDQVLARDVGFSAMQWGLGGQAYHLFRRGAEARPFEPQGYRAMAYCAEKLGRPDLAMLCYEIALAGAWQERFGDFGRIASFDYLRFLRGEQKFSAPEFAQARLRTIGDKVGLKKADLVVIVAWNTDRTDVDLHVIDPTGEVCYYDHPKTKIGGSITKDVTQGFGPEMFVLPNATPGKYQIKVKFFAVDAVRVSARTKVLATIYEDWGTDKERVTRKTVTLAYGAEMHDIATISR